MLVNIFSALAMPDYRRVRVKVSARPGGLLYVLALGEGEGKGKGKGEWR